jgi:hypothetical protein
MSRPAVEVADILHTQGGRFLDRYQSSFGYQKLKAFRAIQNCRTAALGGHLDACLECGYRKAVSYNSCRNRHCPKCQAQARQRWVAAREREVLPTNYFHVVFSVPHELNVFALENPRAFYELLFAASAASALEMAANPERLGAEIGMIAILHTWGQNLLLHPHIHCVIPSGGISPDHRHWVGSPHRFFLPLKALRRVFRGKFIAGLRRLYRRKRSAAPDPLPYSANLSSLPSFWAVCAARTGWSTPSMHSADHCKCCGISAATRTASLSRIIACWPSMESASLSVGAIMRTAISHA